jgi:START domain
MASSSLPKECEDALAAVEAKAREYLKADYDDEFDDAGVLMKRKKTEGESTALFYGFKKCQVSAEKIDATSWASTEEVMKSFNKDMLKFGYTELSENVRLVAQDAKMPWPLTNRSFVMLWKRTKWDDGSLVQLWTSAESDTYPLRPKKFVRGRCAIGAIVLRKTDDGGCEFHRLVNVDPCGNIPGSLVSMLASRHVSGFINFQVEQARKK